MLYVFARPEAELPGEAAPRLGLVVSRQVGGAVERNRVKRRLRAAFDELRDAVAADRDYVLIARPGLAEVAEARPPEWLAAEVSDLFAQGCGAEEAGRR